MNIYLIKHEKFNYDSYMGHIVVSNNESETRKIAKNKFGYEVKKFGILLK